MMSRLSDSSATFVYSTLFYFVVLDIRFFFCSLALSCGISKVLSYYLVLSLLPWRCDPSAVPDPRINIV